MQDPEENRRSNRRRILKSGFVEFGGGAISCIVRNISDGGAALDVTSPFGIPDEFNHVMEADRSDQRRCRVAWRRIGRIGVIFIDAEPKS